MNIVFTPASGFNINNVPASILAMATNVTSDGEHMVLHSEMISGSLMTALRDLGIIAIVSANGRDLVVYQPSIQPAAPQQAPAAQRETVAQAQPVPAPERIPVVQTIATVEASHENLLRCAGAILSGTSAGGSIAMYMQKVAEHTKLLGQMIVTRRQIENISKIVNENDIVRQIQADVAYLTEKCPIVDSVGISTGASHLLSITTKEIITTDLGRNVGKKVVGRMQIIFNMNYMYSATPPDTNFIRSIDIRNLDRAIKDSEVFWMCGHVFKRTIDANCVEACYGGYEQHIIDGMTTRNLPLVFDTLIRYIQNPTIDDAYGVRIKLFPGAPNEA